MASSFALGVPELKKKNVITRNGRIKPFRSSGYGTAGIEEDKNQIEPGLQACSVLGFDLVPYFCKCEKDVIRRTLYIYVVRRMCPVFLVC